MQKLTASDSLQSWLTYIEAQHTKTIDLGLERLAKVAEKLNIRFANSKVITVAGTNGKGTTCACLEQLCIAHGKSTAVYSSPHIIDYTERLRVNGEQLTEQKHVDAFALIEQTRGDIPLTYFEFGTLAGILLAEQAKVDIVILEVGLGGRLDAVNIIDPNVAVITTVDIDHIEYLGDNREDIGREKAGILRQDIDFVCGELNPPESVKHMANELSVNASWINQQYDYQQQGATWNWASQSRQFKRMPIPTIPLQNAATALKTASLVLALDEDKVHQAMAKTCLPGRMQQIQASPKVILDVAHNPQACELLAINLSHLAVKGKLIAVVAMLADKDMAGSLARLADSFDQWYLATLDNPRGATADNLVNAVPENQQMLLFDSVNMAYDKALENATDDDVIIVFGSFFTVAEILGKVNK